MYSRDGTEPVRLESNKVFLEPVNERYLFKDILSIKDGKDPIPVTLSATPLTISENGGVSVVTVTLGEAVAGDVTVTFGYEGTASMGGSYKDYNKEEQVIIPQGDLSADVNITAIADNLYEGAAGETVIVHITNVTGGGAAFEFNEQEQIITIDEQTAPPDVALAIDGAAEINELIAPNSTNIKAILTGSEAGVDVTVTLGYTGTAQSGNVDYHYGSTTIVIPAYQTEGTTAVTADDDNITEGDETIIVDITNVANGTAGAQSQVSVLLKDDEGTPTVALSVAPPAITEAAGSSTVTATMSNPSSSDVTVNLGYTGTATLTDDYTYNSTSITITAGQTTGTATVTAVQDVISEGDETVVVDITSVVNANEDGVQRETITITDDEPVPSVTINADVNTIDENGGVATITATLSGLSDQDITVDFSFGGTATNLDDYTRNSMQITIPVGSTSGSSDVTVTGVDDNVYEGTETVIVDIAVSGPATESGVQQETINITDDETIPTVTLNVSATPIAENAGTSELTVTLSGLSDENVTVDFSMSGVAVNPTDYGLNGAQIIIPAGSLTGSSSITVTGIDDPIYEGDEDIIVDIVVTGGGIEDGNQQEIIIITDDEIAPTVTLTVSPATPIAEAGGVATLTATMTHTSANDVTVNLGYTGTAAGSGTDYNAAATIVIAAGDLTATTDITALQDPIYENPDETVIVDITSVSGAIFDGDEQVIVTIDDDEAVPVVTFTSGDVVIDEDGSTYTLEATTSVLSSEDIIVTLAYSGTTNGITTDYTAASLLTIPHGQLTGTITITSAVDDIYENDETIIIDIDAVSTTATEGAPNQVTVTINDDDDEPTITAFTVDNPDIVEDGGIATITAELSNPTEVGIVTIDLIHPGAGTATGGGVDYTLGASIDIAIGETIGTIDLTGVTDNIFEGDETVIVDVNAVTNATEGVEKQVTVTLEDNESSPTVTLTVDNTDIDEDGNPFATLTATLSNTRQSGDVEVTLSFAGTASNVDGVDYTRAGADYTEATKIITIPAGSLTGDATITAFNDVIFEDPDETVVVEVTNVTNGTEDGSQGATITIIDDEDIPKVTLTVDDAGINENGGTTTLRANLDIESSHDVTVTLGYTGTATNGTDYGDPGSITISAGSMQGTAVLASIDDNIYEGDETVITDITAVTGANENAAQQVTVTITENEAVPVVNLSAAASPVSEDVGTVTITATLDHPSAFDVTVTLGFANGTAVAGSDYTNVATPATITITAGSTTGIATVPIINDDVHENAENFDVTIAGQTNCTAGTDVTVTINDNDAIPSVALTVDHNSIVETDGVAIITATLSNRSVDNVTVNFSINAASTATGGGTDYHISTLSIIIAAGSTAGTVTISSDNDLIYENPDETVIVDIANVTNGTSGNPDQITVTITNDDPVVTVSLDAPSTSPIAENGGTSTINATLSGLVGNDVVVTVGFTGTNITGADYNASSTTITIPAGSLTSGTPITITGLDDNLYEGNEDLLIDITNVTGAQNNNVQRTVTITDAEAQPEVTLSINNTPIAENGGTSTIKATLNRVSYQDVTVDLAYTGTATAGSDYTGGAGPIVILAGDLTAETTVTAQDDNINEPDETIIVDISGVTNGTEAAPQQETITIGDDDPDPIVTIAANTSPIVENGGVSTLTATLTTRNSVDVDVTIAYTGVAVNGTDYTALTTITVPALSLTETTDITATQDLIYEGDETVVASISAVSVGAIGSPNSATVIITDDETAPAVSLTSGDATIAEDGGIYNLTATLSKEASMDITVTVGYTGDPTCVNGNDYNALTTIVIPAGSMNASITVTGVNDDIYEAPSEDLVATITGADNGTTIGTPDHVTVILTDDDPVPTVTLSRNNANIAENGGVSTLTATLSNATEVSDVVVYLAYAGTATSGDYTAAASITVALGSLTGTEDVTGVDDNIYEQPDETIIVDIDNVTGSGVTEDGVQQVMVTINDDDPMPTVSFTATSPIDEAAGSSTLTFTLTNPSNDDVDITVAYSDGTATGGGVDYHTGSTTATILAGSTTATINLAVVTDNDNIDEDDETVLIDITSVVNANNGSAQQTVTITDDDAAPTVTLTAAPHTIAEGGGASTVTVTLSNPAAYDIDVTLAYSGTATTGEISGELTTVTILAGNTSNNFNFTADVDPWEGDETVVIDITAVSGAATEDGMQQETVTIQENSGMPTITLLSDLFLIDELTPGTATITATLDAAAGVDVDVTIAYTGSATKNEVDYNTNLWNGAGYNHLIIPAGSLTNTFTITAINDNLYEAGNENVIVYIDDVQNAVAFGDERQDIEIDDAHGVPTISLVTSADINEGNPPAAGNTGTFYPQLSHRTVEVVTLNVDYSTNAGTAINGNDYTDDGVASFTIYPGDLVPTFAPLNANFTTIPDEIYEPDETVTMTMTSVVHATVPLDNATITILNDDGQPTVSLSRDVSPINEDGGESVITATLSNPSFEDITVTLGYSGDGLLEGQIGQAAEGFDYTYDDVNNYARKTVVIPAYDTEISTTLQSKDDDIYEMTEDVDVTITNTVNATIGAPNTVNIEITDAEVPPTVTLQVLGETVTEGGQAMLRCEASHRSVWAIDVTVAYTGEANSDIGYDDYTTSGTLIQIPAMTYNSVTGTEITITTIDDSWYEGEVNEMLYADITDTDVNGVTAPYVGTGHIDIEIIDNEALPTITVNAGAASIAENGGFTTLTAVTNIQSDEEVVLTLNYDDNYEAIGGGIDYTVTGGGITITIPAHTGNAVVTVTAVQDDIFEDPDETINPQISNVVYEDVSEADVQNCTINQTADVITIIDDDVIPTLVGFDANVISIDEETEGSSVVTATLSHPTSDDVIVTVVYSGTATFGSDYTRTVEYITIPASHDVVHTTGTTTITVTDDNIFEGDEDILMDITDVSNVDYIIPLNQVGITIVDNEVIPDVTLSVDNNSIPEDGGVATLTATLSNPSYQDVTVNVFYTGTATNGVDYAEGVNPIVIPAGSTMGTTTVTGITDDIYEGINETVIVDIDVVNATENVAQQQTITIIDGQTEPTVMLSVNPDAIAEDGGIADVTLTLSNASVFDVQIDLAYSGDAQNPADYTGASASLTISAGDLTAMTTVNAQPDDIYEGVDETVVIDIANVNNGTEDGVQQATVTIIDAEDLPTVTIGVDDNSITENGGMSVITASLNHATDEGDVEVTFNYTGTATNGTDYTVNATVTIPQLSTDASINIATIDDNIYEGNETVIVDVVGVTNATESGEQQQTVMILDDESIPTVALTADINSINEDGGVSVLTATLSNPTVETVTVEFEYTGTATDGSDYSGSMATVTIPALSTTAQITITGVPDNVYEGNETVVIDISNVYNAIEAGTEQQTVTILDAETVPTVSITVGTDPIDENNGLSVLTATLSHYTAMGDVTVELGFSGDADFGVDYNSTATVTIPLGALTGNVTITSIDDNIYEGDETVTVDITGTVNANMGVPSQANVTITDDDAEPTVTLSVDLNSIDEDGGVAVLTANLSNPRQNGDVEVTLNFDGTAMQGVDYNSSVTTIVIPEGASSGTAVVSSIDDNTFEGDETVIADIVAVINATEVGDQMQTVTIVDNETEPVITMVSDVNAIIENGGFAQLTFELSNPSIYDVDVAITYSGTAEHMVDYNANTTVNIPAGTTTGTVNVLSIDDLIYETETDETVVVNIVVTNATEANGDQQETITIIDDDAIPELTLSVSKDAINENGDISVLTAILSNPTVEDVTVNFAYTGTAENGADYTIADNFIFIPAGSMQVSLDLVGLADDFYEGDETVIIDVESVVNAIESGSEQEIVTILDEQVYPSASITVDTETILEYDGVAEITATLDNKTTEEVVVTLAYTGVAENGVDYNANVEITIPAFSMFATTLITSIDDNIYEQNEDIIINIDNVTNANEGSPSDALVTIYENDEVPIASLNVNPASIVEDGGVSEIIVSLDHPTVYEVQVEIGYTGGTATGGGIDYFEGNTVVTIPALSMSGSTTLTAVADDIYEGADEFVLLQINSVNNANEDGVQEETITIIDAENEPTVSISASDYSIAENGGLSTITAVLSNPTVVGDVVIDFSYTGTADNGMDYNALATVTIPVGTTTNTVSISSIDDNYFEGNETVTVDVTAVTNAAEFEVQQETVTIIDDELFPLVTMSLSNQTTNEGSQVELSVELNNPTTEDVTVNLVYTGTANGDGDDYTANSQVYIEAGQTTSYLTITTVNDGILEGNETVVIDIDGVVNADESGNQQETLTIIDNESGNDATLPVDGSAACQESDDWTVTIYNAQANVTYSAYIVGDNSSIASGIGNGSNLVLDISESDLALGDNMVTIYADNVNVVGDELYLNNLAVVTVNLLPDATLNAFGNTVEDGNNGTITVETTQGDVSYNLFVNNNVVATTVGTGLDIDITVADEYLNIGENLIEIQAATEYCSSTLDEVPVIIVIEGPSIPKGFSPNGDEFNEYFVVKDLDIYPYNSIVIINRHGQKVYEAAPYNNDWNGKTMFGVEGEDLPEGTYFYILDLGLNKEPIKGWIYIKR